MSGCYDAITVTLVWHQDTKHWAMGWQQLTYCGEHDHRGALVASSSELLERRQPLDTPLHWACAVLQRLLHDPAQPWQPLQLNLLTDEDAVEEGLAAGPDDPHADLY